MLFMDSEIQQLEKLAWENCMIYSLNSYVKIYNSEDTECSVKKMMPTQYVYNGLQIHVKLYNDIV